jgi:hypothetical protein
LQTAALSAERALTAAWLYRKMPRAQGHARAANLQFIGFSYIYVTNDRRVSQTRLGCMIHNATSPSAWTIAISFFNPSHYKLSVEHAPVNTYSGDTSWAGTKRDWVSKTPMNFWLVVVMLCLQFVRQFGHGS